MPRGAWAGVNVIVRRDYIEIGFRSMKKNLSSSGFTQNDLSIVRRDIAWKGFFTVEEVTLRHRLFAGGESAVIKRELFRRGNAVGVLLYDPVRDVVGLLEQFRVGALAEPSPWLLEIVAGMTKEGESPQDVALRELEEEAGILQVELSAIGDYLLSPGGTDEKIFLYCGIADLPPADRLHGLEEEAEDIRYFTLPREQAIALLDDGVINNAAAAIALGWLARHYKMLQDRL